MQLKKSLLFLLLLVSATLIFNACKSDPEEPESDIAKVNLNFGFSVDGQDLTLGDTYTINGTAVSFEIVKFYTAGINLHPEEGDHVKFDDLYLLVDPAEPTFELGEMTKGHYHMLNFKVGVLPEDNDQTEDDFTSRESDDPLAAQNPAMHWNWDAGYKFIRVDGLTDTDGDGTPETAMAFHLGKDAFLTDISLMMHGDLEAGENQVEVSVDLAKLNQPQTIY